MLMSTTTPPDGGSGELSMGEVAGFVDWMFDQGMERRDLVYALEKPWKHTDWIDAFRSGGSIEDVDGADEGAGELAVVTPFRQRPGVAR